MSALIEGPLYVKNEIQDSMLAVAGMDFHSNNPGPLDHSVLYDQDKHVSAAVWEGQERGALRCHEHTSKLDTWVLTDKQIELVKKSGFGYLRLIPAISLDNPLISALVERWRRETNTFHFSVGEMTITLEDVAYLLGLPIDGKPVIGVTYTTCEAVCVKYLGKAPDAGYTSGGMVKLSWLKENFTNCSESAIMEDIERYTRAYLLYLVGSTIFSTTTGNKVPVMYLPLFDNFSKAGKYAWGAAALSFLYRALGNASLKSQSTISGCLTLLQCWGYYHLDIGRPRLKHDPIHECFPFVLRWKGKQSGPTANRDVAYYRKLLDSLKASDVEWYPYANISHTVIPTNILNSLVLGRSKTMLICFDKAERHLPDRCLRQFGINQTIPEDVQRWERKTRGVDGGVDLSVKMVSELSEWSNRSLHIIEAEEGDTDESQYMQWYLRITRRLVGRLVPISSEFQRMNLALRDVALIADTLSTHGMDNQQIEAVSRIRYIVHDCLRDHVLISSSMVIDNSTRPEQGKRARGKEKVRRKAVTTGKRRRKDDSSQHLNTKLVGNSDSFHSEINIPCPTFYIQACGENESSPPAGDHKVDEVEICDTATVALENSDDKEGIHGGTADHKVDDVEICDIVTVAEENIDDNNEVIHGGTVDHKVDEVEIYDTVTVAKVNSDDKGGIHGGTVELPSPPPHGEAGGVQQSSLENNDDVSRQVVAH